MKPETIRACSIWRALEVVGDVPVLLILERAFLGTNSFASFVEETGVPRSVVSDRLKRLVAEDCLVKKPEPGERHRHYRLTQKGRDLFPAALAMLGWQHCWESGQRGHTVQLIHKQCGELVEPCASCHSCAVKIDPRDVDWEPGPGLVQVVPHYSGRRRPSNAVTSRRINAALVDTVIALFGDRWSTLIVRAMFSGLHRFDQIQKDTLMAPNVLSGRIAELVESGILTSRQYTDTPPRLEYRLTAKGRALYPVILSLLQWGDRYYADTKGPPLLLSHKPCGDVLEMVMACNHCGEKLDLVGVTYQTL